MKHLSRILFGACCALLTWTSVAASESQNIHVQWSVNVDQRLPNAPTALSAPAVVEHEGKTRVVLAGRDGWVHVYDLTGTEIHRFFLGEASDSGTLVLRNGLLVLGDVTGRLYGVDPFKGEVVWQVQLTASFTSYPVAIGDDFLVQTTDNRIYRFSQEGEKKWSFSGQSAMLSMYLSAAPLVDGDYVYAVLSQGDAVALKAESGDLLWKRQLLLSNESAVLSELKAPLAAPILLPKLHMDGEKLTEALLVPFFQGDLVVLSAKDGSQGLSLPISLKSSPVVLGSILYAADSTGFLHAYNIKKGGRLWSKKITTNELQGPVVWQDSLWITDENGVIYRTNQNGEVQSTVTLPGAIARLPLATSAGLLVRTGRGAMYMVAP